MHRPQYSLQTETLIFELADVWHLLIFCFYVTSVLRQTRILKLDSQNWDNFASIGNIDSNDSNHFYLSFSTFAEFVQATFSFFMHLTFKPFWIDNIFINCNNTALKTISRLHRLDIYRYSEDRKKSFSKKPHFMFCRKRDPKMKATDWIATVPVHIVHLYFLLSTDFIKIKAQDNYRFVHLYVLLCDMFSNVFQCWQCLIAMLDFQQADLIKRGMTSKQFVHSLHMRLIDWSLKVLLAHDALHEETGK